MHDIMYVCIYICIYIYILFYLLLFNIYIFSNRCRYIHVYSYIYIFTYTYIHIYTHIYRYTHIYTCSCRTVLGSLDFHGFSTWCWLKRTVIHPDLIAISCMNVKFSEDISWRLSELAPKISQKKEIAMFYEYV